MIRIVGLDPSLRGTGIAVYHLNEPGGAPIAGCTTVTPSDSQPIEHRLQVILAQVWHAVRTDCPTFVAIERPFVHHGTSGDTTLKLGGLHYLIRYGLHRRGVPFMVLDNAVVKQYATGAGNAGKEIMLEAARHHLRHLTHVSDDNQADALWLLAMAHHKYIGRRLHGNAPAHSLNLIMAKVTDWPQWNIPAEYRPERKR